MNEFDICEKVRKEILNDKTTSPLKAIHNFCISCMGYHKAFVKDCTSVDCPLYMMRTGKNKAKSKKEYTNEQKKAIAERLNEARTKGENKRNANV